MTHNIYSKQYEDLTAEEKNLMQSDNEQLNAEIKAKADAEVKKEADAKAGNDKLIELGLTQDQVTAMTGYTPPSESEE